MKKLLGALGAACVLLCGCGGGGASSQNGSGVAAQGGTLRISLYAEPRSLNPLLATNTAENFVDSLDFDELVTLDNHGNDVADLAATVPTLDNGGIAKNGLTITYHLRHGVKWQDGAPFSSADVKFSWEAVMNPADNVVERTGYDDVRSVDTPDPYTVVFHLIKPYAPFIDTVFGESDNPYRVIPKHLLARYSNINKVPFNEAPIGTGPFKVARWIHGDRIEMVANPYYFRGKPHLARIDIRIVPDNNTEEAMLRSHDVDLAVDIATANLGHLRGAPGIRTLLVKSPSYFAVIFNTTAPPLNDLRVRRAIAMAIDEHRISATTTYGTGTRATADLSDFYWAYDPHLKPLPYDPAAARALLKAAGWRPGSSLQLAYGSGDTTAAQQAVQIQSELRAVGISVQVKSYDYSTLFATAQEGGILQSGKFEMAEYGWISGGDPDDSGSWTCAARAPHGNNVTRYCNPAMDAAEQDALTHFSRAARTAAYARTQRLLLHDVPAAFQYYQPDRYAMSDRLQHFTPNGVSAGWNAYQWAI